MSGHLQSMLRHVAVVRGFSTSIVADVFRRTAVTSSMVDKTPGDVALKVTR